jgi:hypothetical protein
MSAAQTPAAAVQAMFRLQQQAAPPLLRGVQEVRPDKARSRRNQRNAWINICGANKNPMQT